MPRSKNRLLAYFFLLLNTALWGFSVPIIKYSLGFTSPTVFLLYRYLVATAIFLPIFLLYRARHPRRINHLQTILLAILGTPICLLLSYYGLSMTSSIEGAIIDSTSPLFTIVLCLIFLGETLKPRKRRGLALALLGTLLIAVEPLILHHNHVQLSVEGNFLIIASDIVWGIFLLLSKKFHTDPVYLTFYSFAISIPLFYLASSFQGISLIVSSQALPGIAYMAIGGSIIAFWAYLEGQKRIEAAEAAIFTYLKPAFAIPLSILWLKEGYSLVAVVATILIIAGVYISEKR
jgi:drug/metabolite transporter (DMT)-like permease